MSHDARGAEERAKEAAREEALAAGGGEEDPLKGRRAPRVADRETEYHSRRLAGKRAEMSPGRADPFKEGGAGGGRSYADVLAEARMEREEAEVARAVQRKVEEAQARKEAGAPPRTEEEAEAAPGERKRRRWDSDAPPPAKRQQSRWGATPVAPSSSSSASAWDDTPVAPSAASSASAAWDDTPVAKPAGDASSASSAWENTPVGFVGATPVAPRGGASSSSSSSASSATPLRGATPGRRAADPRNRPWTDAELDALLPAEGYEILPPPAGYVPVQTPARRLAGTPPAQGAADSFYSIPDGQPVDAGVPTNTGDLPFRKEEDYQHFAKLLEKTDESELAPEERREREVMLLLLKVKNGNGPQRKTALRQITERAREFGPEALFNQIMPLLMSATLEDQERHLLVKVIDRVLYKLDDLVRPYVHKILVVILPLLIDQDRYARAEGRNIVSNLAKAAGLATMIATMRPDIDSADEYVRNTTTRALAVVASALGVHSLLPFLKAVCGSRRSWLARETGMKVVQQIAILMGCAVLPHLRSLVSIVRGGLADEQAKVRMVCALSLAALAEAAAPYGIESFDAVLRPLWEGVNSHRGKVLAAFLKAVGYVIPLMEDDYAAYYTREVMPILVREFASPDEEMKKIVLQVVRQCVQSDGVPPAYVREEVVPEFFRHFWVRRTALDRRSYRQLVLTTEEVSAKVGGGVVVGRVVDGLKDESEPYRRMVLEAVSKVLGELGAADVDEALEKRLMDGVLHAFQEQTSEQESRLMLDGVGGVIAALGGRARKYLPQIAGIIRWRLNNRSPAVRQQAAQLVARVAPVMKECGDTKMLGNLAQVLYEFLGEEYPEVLGAIIAALSAAVDELGVSEMRPPVGELLLRLTPVLRNRAENVQEPLVGLIGRIADRGAAHVSVKEWMRICFELLDLLRARRKAIRVAAVSTFGYIAKAIGPHDVLATLLNNLRVQERSARVSTTVAIAVCAEMCGPFTVLPALMNEYRVPDVNAQHGVLKALSFAFEYVGEQGAQYAYAVTPLLADALADRDAVHRQTACAVVKHMALGAAGQGREDAMLHLLNFVWPNIFETSPHVINAVMDAVEALRVALGPTRIVQYTLQGLFHPARRVRTVYWRIYNALYVSSQDALVPAMPRIEADPVVPAAEEDEGGDAAAAARRRARNNPYRRWEMEAFL